MYHSFLWLIETCAYTSHHSSVSNHIRLKHKSTTLSNGYLGSRNDEERSEMRYVMRIAEFSESSNLWTQMALSGYSWKHASLSISFNPISIRMDLWSTWCQILRYYSIRRFLSNTDWRMRVLLCIRWVSLNLILLSCLIFVLIRLCLRAVDLAILLVGMIIIDVDNLESSSTGDGNSHWNVLIMINLN
jgi:hypothetical protein